MTRRKQKFGIRYRHKPKTSNIQINDVVSANKFELFDYLEKADEKYERSFERSQLKKRMARDPRPKQIEDKDIRFKQIEFESLNFSSSYVMMCFKYLSNPDHDREDAYENRDEYNQISRFSRIDKRITHLIRSTCMIPDLANIVIAYWLTNINWITIVEMAHKQHNMVLLFNHVFPGCAGYDSEDENDEVDVCFSWYVRHRTCWCSKTCFHINTSECNWLSDIRLTSDKFIGRQENLHFYNLLPFN